MKDWVEDRIDEVSGFFEDLPDDIAGFFEGLADTIKAPFETAFEAIKDLWNDTLGGFEVPEITVPGVGTVGGWAIPTMHTGGGVNDRRADEVVRILQRGEAVLSAGATARLHDSLTSGSQTSQPSQVRDLTVVTQATDTAAVVAELRWQLARGGI